MILKIVLTDGTCQRLTLSNGLPESIKDLIGKVKTQCGLQHNIRLQFMDSLFGNKFLNLTSISEVADKGTLKVIGMSRPTTMLHEDYIVLDLVQDSEVPSASSVNHSFLSDGSVDTDVLSSSESTSSLSSWPAVFYVPKFPYDVELKLQQASMAYNQKSTILDGLVQEIVQYKVYVSDKEMDHVAQSLIKKHPCLTERGSTTGCGGWKTSLKYKLANYRT
ncbi:hypothetical protein CRENBAI_009127 [Crenichthys baileyi]|uniref:Uncharacterized protein n=1 Tax=Crenichthys baileyi TaxID=28760 RepID=A0AAV9QTM2_9TELE